MLKQGVNHDMTDSHLKMLGLQLELFLPSRPLGVRNNRHRVFRLHISYS
jgi:hypothetical protein